MPPLVDMRMHDGSRYFGSVPETFEDPADWHLLREAILRLPGALLVSFVTDEVTEAWLDFHFGGEQFAANNQHREWWLFVQRPEAADALLLQVLEHFTHALSPRTRQLRAAGAMAPATFRVFVAEADGREHCRDFASDAIAIGYADDCATETSDGQVSAWVYDDGYRLVHTGRHH